MFKRFLPKEPKFFKLLAEISDYAFDACKILNEMLDNSENLNEYAAKIHVIENKCDEITHTVKNELNESFITPIDREDIFALVNALDDIVDTIDTISNRWRIYKIKSPLKFGPQLASILLSQTELLSSAIKTMQNNYKDALNKLVSIRNLETEGDVVFRDAITDLFDTEKDVLELIKKKEILEIIEKAVDRCQWATLVIEGALIKNI